MHREPEPHRSSTGALILMWLLVAIPLAWGIYQTTIKASLLFTAR